jgi:uroporphyrin-III C-methyltransferase
MITPFRVGERNKSSFAEECINSQTSNKPNVGKVFLVGAGPGDPELLTLKAFRLISSADIVFYDSLISDEILKMIPRNAERVHVGKRAKKHLASQDEINQLLVDYAIKGLRVVRLKGGDPFIFGRGGEELQELIKHNIQFEVVPGITAASGCASYAGIPLTHRDYSQSVVLVTAHQKDPASVNWQSMVADNQTLVFYMGILKNRVISSSLIAHGLDENTPVAVVERGTQINQRVVVGKLGQLSELVEGQSIEMPALIIVGKVVSLAEQLSWFTNSFEENDLQPSHQLAANA